MYYVLVQRFNSFRFFFVFCFAGTYKYDIAEVGTSVQQTPTNE